jgi:hypothetical protein
MLQLCLAKIGFKILGPAVTVKVDQNLVEATTVSHCDSWSKILGFKCLFFFGWTNWDLD